MRGSPDVTATMKTYVPRECALTFRVLKGEVVKLASGEDVFLVTAWEPIAVSTPGEGKPA